MKGYIVGKGTPRAWLTDPWDVMDLATRSWIVVPPQGLEEFIDPEKQDGETRLIHGPKGSGKSALLIAKRMLLKRDEDNRKVVCIPSAYPYVFTSRGETDGVTFKSWAKVAEYATIETWTHLWKLIFGSYVIAALEKDKRYAEMVGAPSRNTDEQQPPLLPIKLGTLLLGARYSAQKDLGSQNANIELSAILRYVIEQSSLSPDDLREAYENHILPTFNELAQQPDGKRVFIFVDAVDELLKSPISGDGFLKIAKSGMSERGLADLDHRVDVDDKGMQYLAMNLWACAQVSLVSSSYEMAAATRTRVRLVGTFRTEARDHRPFSKNRAQLGNLLKEARYSKDTLEVIFRENIKVCERGRMVEPEAPDELRRFFGMTRYVHYATKKEESVFSGILRHTFEEPRELMVMGRGLYELDREIRKDVEKAANVINETTDIVLTDYLDYMGERWNEELADLIFRKIGTNVLSAREVASICSAVASESNGRFLHPFCYLYSLGLIGVPSSGKNRQEIIQEFLLPARFPYKRVEAIENRYRLPDADSYFIHPVLAERIRQVRRKDGLGFSTHGAAIIGDGLPWNIDITLAKVTIRRHVAQDGKMNSVLLSLSIDGHELGYDELSQKTNSFASLTNRVTYIFVALLLALQKKRKIQQYVNTSRISLKEYLEATSFLSGQDDLHRKLGIQATEFERRLEKELHNYQNGSKKYPPSLTQINARMKAAGISSVSVGTDDGELIVDGIPANEIHIHGFGSWD